MAKKDDGNAGVGHNSAINGIAKDQLKSVVERIEKLEEEKKAIATDIKEIKQEAKGNGFDISMINEMVKVRRLDAKERQEREDLRDVYMHALGLIADMPLGQAAMEAAGATA